MGLGKADVSQRGPGIFGGGPVAEQIIGRVHYSIGHIMTIGMIGLETIKSR